MEFLQVLVWTYGGMLTARVLAHASPPASFLQQIAWLTAVLVAVVAVHGLGHVIAAACAGMRVLRMSIIYPMSIERRLRGARIRLYDPVPGMVAAVPDFSGSVRRQMLWFAGGGPFASAFAAVLCLLLAWPVSQPMELWLISQPMELQPMELDRALWFAFGVYNGTWAIVSLIPTVRRLQSSDGLLLVRWWRNGPDMESSRRVLQVYDQSLQGMIASEIPRHQIDWFETCDDINRRFFGRYLALRAAQQCRDDAAFAAIFARCEHELKTSDQEKFEALRPLWALFQVEYVFESVCNGETAEQPIEWVLLRKMPLYLQYRLAAAQAWARGDASQCHRMIEKAERDVQGAFDAGARRAEPALLDRLRALSFNQ
jgi:hypothetical protein